MHLSFLALLSAILTVAVCGAPIASDSSIVLDARVPDAYSITEKRWASAAPGPPDWNQNLDSDYHRREDVSTDFVPDYRRRNDASADFSPDYRRRNDASADFSPDYRRRKDASADFSPDYRRRTDASADLSSPDYRRRADASVDLSSPDYRRREDSLANRDEVIADASS